MSVRSNARASFLEGAQAISPILLGIVPFGLIAGVAGVAVGLTALQTWGLSVLIFAGASQLAAIELMGDGASVAVLVLTVWLINLRMAMYSATIAPFLRGVPAAGRAVLGYSLTDQAFGVCILRFRDGQVARPAWYLGGASAVLWVTWQVSTIVGAVLGAAIPEELGLTFTIPLTFLAVLVPTLRDRPSLVAALVGGAVAVAAAPLPNNLGLLAGAFAGIGAGLAAERPHRHDDLHEP